MPSKSELRHIERAHKKYMENPRPSPDNKHAYLLWLLEGAKSADKHGRYATRDKKLKEARELIETIEWGMFRL